jgi:hypothetical protein
MADQPELLFYTWGNLSVPWADYTSRQESAADIALSYGQGCQAMRSIMFYWEDFWSENVAAQILGYSFFDRGTGSISRQTPLPHPWLPQCYATRITSIKDVRWLEKGNISATGTKVSVYKYVVVTVQFSMPNYVVLNDTQLDSQFGVVGGRQEWQRYLSFEFETDTDVIQRPGAAAGLSSFKYADGPNATRNFPNPINQKLTTATLLLTWRQVPRNGLFSNGGTGPPTNLLNAINTVNQNGFLGWPNYVLRCDPPRFIELQSPVPATLLGLNPIYSPPICYDVQLRLSWRDMAIDPGYGDGWGHNAFPLAASKYWYLATIDGTPPVFGDPITNSLFNSSDFTQIFAMNT